ncbi:lysophospholipid acyltransferase 1-like [Iris pallida]|uniref:Lysophospholipid acyltransferase 1-like n=1 Tax=Iris pallida TaxID=29817 RepID=A0AAX6GSY6_IRIPA|nr:lysophospholipid acyltransferase 1-like [Iris pallida]
MLLMLTNFAYTLLVLNYTCIGFMVNSLVMGMKETLPSYQRMYFVGTILPISHSTRLC